MGPRNSIVWAGVRDDFIMKRVSAYFRFIRVP